MKTKLITFVLALMSTLAWPARAQFSVVDKPRFEQARIQHQQLIKQFSEVQERQDQQIVILTQQLARLTFIAEAVGNPRTNTTLAGGQSVLDILAGTGVDRSRSDILGMTEAALTVARDVVSIYRIVDETFLTRDGKSASRDTAAYRPFAAISGAAANHDAVAQNVKERRERLRAAMRETVVKIAQAGTSTEVQKLQGVLSAQMAELETADKELDFATSKVLVQDIENRSEQARQAAARIEEQAAEMSATINGLGETLRPNTAPLRFKK